MPHVSAFINPGSAPMPLSDLRFAFPDASSKVVEVLVAKYPGLEKSGIAVADFGNELCWSQLESGARGWSVALTSDTATAVDADGSPGSGSSVAQTSYTTDPTVWKKRVRASRTTKLDALKGREFDVYVRCKATAAAKHRLQLRWSPSTADPVANTEDEVIHETTNAAAFGYVFLRLGRIRMPDDASIGGLALEFWSRRESGTGSLNWDYLALMPALVPGASEPLLTKIVVGGGSSEITLGKDLATPVTSPASGTAGAVELTYLDCDETTDNAGIPPNTGLALPAGRHRWTFDLRGPTVGPGTALIRLRDITAGNDEASRTVTYQSQERRTESLEVDISDSNLYQAGIDDFTSVPNWAVFSIEHEFTPYLSQNQQTQADADNVAVLKLDSSGNALQPLGTEGGVPLWADPGLNVFIVHILDVKKASYNEEESVRARTLTLSPKGAPRYLG